MRKNYFKKYLDKFAKILIDYSDEDFLKIVKILKI